MSDAEPFVFGTQYLRGMTPLPADWDRDMATMRGLGMNTIRAWIVWGVVEPAPGELDTHYLDSFLDTAERHGLRVGLLFHLHGAPEWAVRQHQAYWYVDAEGRAFEPSARSNTPSGGWPGLCFDNVEVQELEERFIAAVVQHVAHRPNIAFWEPINEPHQWIDFARAPAGVFCYCEATRGRFREWLQEKYGSLAALDAAWGRRHSCWDDVRPPTWCCGLTDWVDWRSFTTDSIAALVARRADIICRHATQPVVGHAWGGGSVSCPALGAMAFDDWKNARPLDKWGYSAFPGSVGGALMLGLGTDATRAAADGKEFWQSELGSGDHGYGFERRGRVHPRLLELWCWESIRHGARGLLFWQFRKERQGSEIGALGLTDYGGGLTENARAVAGVGKILVGHSALFHGSRPPKAEVALVFSFTSYLTEWAQRRDCKLCVDSMSGYYRMLWEDNIPVDILHEDTLDAAALASYKTVILPMPATLPRPAATALAEYVKNGGTLISDPFLCGFDERQQLPEIVPGDGFAEVFGCHERDITTDAGEMPLLWDGERLALRGGHFREWFDTNGGEPVARYADGATAVVSNAFGKGRAVMLGVNLGLCYSPREGVGDDITRSGGAVRCPDAKRLISSIIAEAGVTSPLPCSEGIRATLLSSPDGDLLIAFNITDAPVHGTLTLPRAYLSCSELHVGEAVNLHGAEIREEFSAWETKVFSLK